MDDFIQFSFYVFKVAAAFGAVFDPTVYLVPEAPDCLPNKIELVHYLRVKFDGEICCIGHFVCLKWRGIEPRRGWFS